MPVRKEIKRPYSIWWGMISRCRYDKLPYFKNYGGRGIKYDESWSLFNNWWNDMKPGYADNLTLDRIDNSGNYCKENCRWVDMKVQSNNCRTNRHLIYKGEDKTIAEWGRKLKVDPNRIHTRFNRGWNIERIIETPFIPFPQRRNHKRSSSNNQF